MNSKLVSIIIPVYNCEKYLSRCLDSLIQQTYSCMEIILVDDGSLDQSPIICDEYQKKVKFIQAFQIEHTGVAGARNFGLEIAHGEYIIFVDADDFVKAKFVETMVTSMEKKQVDMVVCSYIRKINYLNISNPKLDYKKIYTNKEYLVNTLKDPGHHYYGVVWNKIYRKKVITEHNLKFLNNVDLGEDFIFNIEYLVHSNFIKVISKKLYFYDCETQDSLSRKSKKNINTCLKEMKNRDIIFQHYRESFQKMGIFIQYENQISTYWLMYYLRNLDYLQFEFRDWKEQDKKFWKNTLDYKPEILDCMKHSSWLKIVINKKKILYRRWMIKLIKVLIFKIKNNKKNT